ncbi:UNVERIFIED_CONTAM: putative late blight resistance proteinR1A-10 [Sesamum radiatum]|uniref:Late blight resistance proteinR1A-10 n=1 Tax=Sesamum radiatum TaxID=300843 RepID=A0AAW2JWA7_SESRA
MGGFPEDYEIHVSKLVKLWVAESFVKPGVSKSFEEGAQEYLEDLVKRSLVLVTRRKSNGKIKSCSVHDLVRDLCIRKAREEKFLLFAMDRYVDRYLPKGIKDQRRLSIARSTLTLFSKINSPIIRTALYFEQCRRLSSSLQCFRLLRVLDVVVAVFSEFPAEVLKLFHLRYLAFTLIDNYDIPASILNLQNLQTLFICTYSIRVRFPLEIWRMTQLRHLVLSMSDPFPKPSAGTFVLKNLQTLAIVRNFKCTKSIVQMIPNLRKLGIFYEGYGIKWREYHLHNLVDLHQLENLKIWVEDRRREPFPLWEKLAFPMMLKKLTLIGCLFRWEDMTAVGSLQNLEVMKLTSCSFEGCKWETTEGEFPRLKFLKIRSTNLQHWVTDGSHFPSLEHLKLFSCKRLGEIPDVLGEIPTLQIIEVNRSDRSLVKSAKQIKEEQQSFGNDSLEVRIVHK